MEIGATGVALQYDLLLGQLWLEMTSGHSKQVAGSDMIGWQSCTLVICGDAPLVKGYLAWVCDNHDDLWL